jgi:sulfate adenylyltransferase
MLNAPHLIEPHGGILVNLYADDARAAAVKASAVDLPSWDLTARQLCDVKLLLCGGFSPLTGFLNEKDYQGVVEKMCLADGTLWPMPITLDVSEDFATSLKAGDKVALRNNEAFLIAVLTIESIYRPDLEKEARKVFGTCDRLHPAVDHLLGKSHPVYLGGKLEGIERAVDYDFKHLRDEPADLRDKFRRWGWTRVVAFQTRNPMHRAHQELTFRAAQQVEANLLIHPVVGLTKPGDIDHFSRVRCYETLLNHYPENTTTLSLLPLAMRMGGPREALWHAIIRKNYGCTHFIVGRDHAGPGNDAQGKPFYGPYDAQELVAKHADELGIEMVPFKEMVYVQDRAQYVPSDEVEKNETVLNISGTEFRRRLREGIEIPEWFSFPETVAELRRAYPPKHEQGFTVLFTGLSGSGKSTIANALMMKLMELGGRSVTLLDGDHVRKHLSSELGFSKEHRNLNILRIGYVASEITKAGGIALCAPIAPYADIRRQVREMVEAYGTSVEVYVSTPIEVCEQRDRKGLYAKARAGILKQFTGIDDPYEAPENPDISIDTSKVSLDEAAQTILLRLEKLGLIR